jgi:hypothetical protein
MAGYGKINAVGDLCCHTMVSQRGYQAHYCIGGTHRHCDPVRIGQMWDIGETIESPPNTAPPGHGACKAYEDEYPDVVRQSSGACPHAC